MFRIKILATLIRKLFDKWNANMNNKCNKTQQNTLQDFLYSMQ